jgi:hypothetical protein
MRDTVGLEFFERPAERGGIGQAHNDDVGNALWIGTDQRSKVENGMVGLDDLMRDGNILPDKNVNVGFGNLCHAGSFL